MTDKELHEKMLEYLQYKPDGTLWWKYQVSNCKMDRPIGTINSKGYLIFSFFKVRLLVHRAIYFYHHGEFPPELTDHINGDRTDNRIENLRSVTSRQNNLNNEKTRAGSLYGIAKDKGKYRARYQMGDKKISLRRRATAEEAHQDYKNKMKELGIETL